MGSDTTTISTGSNGEGGRCTPAGRRLWRCSGRRALVVALATAVAAFGLPAVAPGVASAQDEVPVGNIAIQSPNETQTVQVTEVGDIITVEVGDLIQPGCYTSEVGNTCIGDTTGDGTLNVVGGDSPPVKVEGGPIERLALQWMVEEAVTAVGATYDLPIDERIERYAAPEIRAYMVNRILDIMDREAYNVPLTDDEARTLQLVEQHVLDTDTKATLFAYEEYQRYKSQGCGYAPPAAPALVTQPVGMPTDVLTYCATPRNPLAAAFDFMPPQPSEAHFTTWGTYRQLTELGLGALNNPEFRANVARTAAGIVFYAGVSVAAIAAGLAAGIVGASVLTSLNVTAALLSMPAFILAHQLAGLGLNVGAVATGIATVAVAGAVASVLIGLVILAIAIWQLVEHEKVGTNLADAANRAAAATDPFGLAALQAANQGKELREGMAPDNLPSYRQDAVVGRITEMVTRWMTVGLGGVVQPDATGVWEGSSTASGRDWTWEVTDSTGTHEQAVLLYPRPDGERGTVRFDRGWMVVTDFPQAPRAALRFAYETPDGQLATVVRLPGPDGGLAVMVVSTDPGTGEVTLGEPVPTDSIEFRHPDTGELVTARLVAPGALPRLDGPRPTVAGSLVPGWVHNLRPNPVDIDGNFDLERFRDEYEFAWEVERFDEATQTWVDVPLLEPPAGEPPYGAKFLPTVTGAYRADVTMRPIEDPTAPEATGVVEFRINPPVINFEEATLVDDGFSQLRLDLHLSQNTGGGNLAVEVRWPPVLGSDDPPPVTTLDIECLPLTAVTCDTPRTVNVPVLSSALTHQLGPLSDLTQGVEVTITNDHGGKITRTLAVDHPDRPQFAAPPPPAAGEPALVAFDTNATTVQIPVANPDASPTLVLATIVPGADDQGTPGFSIYDPATGTVSIATLLNGNPRFIASVSQLPDGQWVLMLDATPGMEDLGAFSAPIGIQQNNGRRVTMLLHVDVVPAPDDKYRVFLDSDVDPADIAVDHLPAMVPVVVNGREDWEPYADELCLSLQPTSAPVDPVEKCAPIEEFRGSDGELMFPWAELYPGGVEFGIHRARARLADTDRSWPVEHQVRFFMQSGPPVITDLSWDNTARRLVLGVAPSSATAPVESVTCTLDGAATACFEPTGGPWAPPGLADGAHTVGVTVTDIAGNYDTASLEFEANTPDTTPPVVTSEVVGTLGQGGFYTSDVTVTWTVTDAESDIEETAGCESATINTDAESHVLNCGATSEGGLTEESLTISRDATPPSVTVTGVSDGALYTVGAVPAAGCDTQDATSGVQTQATVTLAGGNPDGTGELTATCAGAVDVAGNAAGPVSANYTVELPTYDDLAALTEELVDRPALRRALNGLVSTAERLDDRGLERASDRILDRYIALVGRSTPRFIAAADADRLIALAEALKAA